MLDLVSFRLQQVWQHSQKCTKKTGFQKQQRDIRCLHAAPDVLQTGTATANYHLMKTVSCGSIKPTHDLHTKFCVLQTAAGTAHICILETEGNRHLHAGE